MDCAAKLCAYHAGQRRIWPRHLATALGDNKGKTGLGLLTDAAPIVESAFWLGVAVVAMTLLMLSAILVMRRLALRRERNHARAVALWRPFVVATAGSEPAAMPALNDQDLSGFILVWNEVHEPLRGRTTANLAQIARRVGLEERLYRLLHSLTFHDRVVAVIALGHVRSEASFSHIEQYLDDKSPIMSLCAARTLMQVDPARAIPKLVPRIVERGDWSQGSVAAILQESDQAIASGPLVAALQQADTETAPRLLRFLAGVSPASAAPVIRHYLSAPGDERMVSTCLQIISNREDLDCVRSFLTHSRWHLRMQAAATLGRLGVPGDEARLITMLTDRQWWVRYRAAQALLGLRFIGSERVSQIRGAQTDSFAQDIIDHVLAERAIGEAT